MTVAFTAALGGAATKAIPPAARLTSTWGQDWEMARHDLLVKHFPEAVHGAKPSRPWLRGANENTNGRLRQYFPKGTDSSVRDKVDFITSIVVAFVEPVCCLSPDAAMSTSWPTVAT